MEVLILCNIIEASLLCENYSTSFFSHIYLGRYLRQFQFSVIHILWSHLFFGGPLFLLPTGDLTFAMGTNLSVFGLRSIHLYFLFYSSF